MSAPCLVVLVATQQLFDLEILKGLQVLVRLTLKSLNELHQEDGEVGELGHLLVAFSAPSRPDLMELVFEALLVLALLGVQLLVPQVEILHLFLHLCELGLVEQGLRFILESQLQLGLLLDFMQL